MTPSLRMLVVGTGAMGRAWLEILRAAPGWCISGIVDSAPDALLAAGEAFGVPEALRFAAAADALDHAPADAVLVVTPPEAHLAASVAALERGLPVFSEKPLADTLASGVAVLDAARRSGAVLMVGQGRRWLPHIVAMRDAVRSGLIGDLGYLTCQFRIPFRFGGWREQMPEVLIEDTIRFITGRNGVRVFAHSFRPAWSWYDGNPCAGVELQLEGDLAASYHGSWVARGPRSSWDGELIVVGSAGALLLREDETVWHYAGERETPEPLPLPRFEQGGLARGLQLFTLALRGEAPSEPSGEDNIHSLALTSAAVASARSAQPVVIADHLREAGWTPPL
jgi:predicted dehydrogenase